MRFQDPVVSADTLNEMLSGIFGLLIVTYFAGMALWFAGALAWDAFQWAWDDLIPGIQGRRARARRLESERPARIPRRVDLRDSEKVDAWLLRRGLEA
jgi:hypothetical protein